MKTPPADNKSQGEQLKFFKADEHTRRVGQQQFGGKTISWWMNADLGDILKVWFKGRIDLWHLLEFCFNKGNYINFLQEGLQKEYKPIDSRTIQQERERIEKTFVKIEDKMLAGSKSSANDIQEIDQEIKRMKMAREKRDQEEKARGKQRKKLINKS